MQRPSCLLESFELELPRYWTRMICEQLLTGTGASWSLAERVRRGSRRSGANDGASGVSLRVLTGHASSLSRLHRLGFCFHDPHPSEAVS